MSGSKKNIRKKGLSNLRNTLGGIKDSLDQNTSNKVLPSEDTVRNFADVPIHQIERNPDQPRNYFDENELKELGKSIKIHGLIQPITVRRLAEGQYQLISGERRLRASKEVGLKEIPAYIRVANDAEMMEMALVENIHRADLNPIEIAITYSRLKKEFNMTDAQLAERVESSRSSVTNFMRLLELPTEIQLGLKERKISMGHGRALLGVDDHAGRIALYNSVIEEGLSVRALENIIKKSKESQAPKQAPKSKLPHEYFDIQDRLTKSWGSKVLLKRDPKTGEGSVSIPFMNDEDLNRLLDLIEE
ncbi:MAG: ParB/RepB/Spo0J family partition protein [Bacteroidota bacterium]